MKRLDDLFKDINSQLKEESKKYRKIKNLQIFV